MEVPPKVPERTIVAVTFSGTVEDVFLLLLELDTGSAFSFFYSFDDLFDPVSDFLAVLCLVLLDDDEPFAFLLLSRWSVVAADCMPRGEGSSILS